MTRRFVSIAFVLFVFTFVASAFAQTPTPQPANQAPIGFVDNGSSKNACTSLQGWALDPTATASELAVHFWEQTVLGEWKFSGAAYTTVLRQDVNDAFGTTGNHGWSFPIPSSLRDSQPHTVYAFAIDTDGGPAGHLALSPVTISCAAASPIRGFVLDQEGFALPSLSWFNTSVTLYKIADGGRADWFNSTDCTKAIGCADQNGEFSFSVNYNGVAPSEGYYEAWFNANKRQVYRARFYYSPSNGAFVGAVLMRQPLDVKMKSWSPVVTANGLEGTFTVCNYGYTGSYALAQITVAGPGKTTAYAQTDWWWFFYTPTQYGTCTDVSVTLPISANLPDGQYYSAWVRVGSPDWLDEVYSDTAFSALKGVDLSVVPAALMRASQGEDVAFDLPARTKQILPPTMVAAMTAKKN